MAIQRSSSGEQTQVGNRVLVKEAASKLGRDGIHAKLAHEHWTGPWRITSVEQPGLSYQATMRGRRIRGRRVLADKLKIFHERPEHMRHDFEDEFVHLARGADLGLGGISTVAVPINTGALEQQANPCKGGPSTSAASTRQGGVAALRVCMLLSVLGAGFAAR